MDSQTQQAINQLRSEWEAFRQNSVFGDHFHNGFDYSRVNFVDIYQKKVWVPFTIYGADAAATANYSTFFTVPVGMTVTGFKESHAVLGTDGSAVTLDLEKLTGTQAPGAGVSILSATLSLKATINTMVTATLTSTLANRSLAVGNRVALKLTGTPTSVANVSVLMELTIV